MTARKEDLQDGPVVVVPERLMLGRSQSYHAGFAASMEAARGELADLNLEDESSPELSSPSTSTPATPGSPMTPAAGDAPSADSFAFAFDIDGVLIRGGRPIPEAIEAMRVLNGENEYGVKVYVSPFKMGF